MADPQQKQIYAIITHMKTVTEMHLIPGPMGVLEAEWAMPIEAPREGVAAILCHPHSLHGGTMQNKVVATLARVFHTLHMPTLRFNFRSVGKSEGHYGEGIGEMEDVKASMAWLQEKKNVQSIWLGGFSFGAFVAYGVASDISVSLPIKGLITVAPPTHHFPFEHYSPPACPWITVIAEQDEIVPAAVITDWLAHLTKQPIILNEPDATHFFHGHLITLREKLVALLTPYLNPNDSSNGLT